MLLFDIDGTLLLTGGAGRIAFEKAFFELFGIENAWGQTLPDGKTDPAIIQEIAQKTIRRILSEEEYKKLCQRYLSYFSGEIGNSPRFRLLPGVPELLEQLAKIKELTLGIATGNFKEAAMLKLEKGSLRHYFLFGGFGCDSHERVGILTAAIERGGKILGATFSPSQIFVIGDTPQDILAAKKIGAHSIAVATGRLKEKELASHAPAYLFPDLKNTHKFLQAVVQ